MKGYMEILGTRDVSKTGEALNESRTFSKLFQFMVLKFDFCGICTIPENTYILYIERHIDTRG